MQNAFRENTDSVIWIHCASLGEFEQGRPLIEKLKLTYTDHKILLTFFSPSGYEVRKNYKEANWVFYLPLDKKSNARKFIQLVKPKLVVFVKYEYWYNYLNELNKANIPTILVSAIFRKDAIFFKWYGSLHRKMLNFFNQVFVQNTESFDLVKTILSADKISLAGDTRFDRVVEIAQSFEPIELIARFAKDKKLIVAGSTWPEDEEHLKRLKDKFYYSLIIAPHEISKDHLQFLNRLFPDAIFYSQLKENEHNISFNDAKVLIIDNIGMLSKLYYYSTISYIGGGFNKSGIHNTLEAAVYGKPVVFGPNYKKFAEAINLIKNKGGFSYSNENELFNIIKYLSKSDNYSLSCKAAADYVNNNTGATDKIISWLKQNAF